MKKELLTTTSATKPSKPQPLYMMVDAYGQGVIRSGEAIHDLNEAIGMATVNIHAGANEEIIIYKMIPVAKVKKADPIVEKFRIS